MHRITTAWLFHSPRYVELLHQFQHLHRDDPDVHPTAGIGDQVDLVFGCFPAARFRAAIHRAAPHLIPYLKRC